VAHRYQSRVSGPLIDRIDLQIYVRPLTGEQMLAPSRPEASSALRERVVRARAVQKERFAPSGHRLNATMSPKEVLRFCPLRPSGRVSLRRAVDSLGLSARAFDRILKVARTIADLDGGCAIKDAHLQEAIEYRSLGSEQLLK